MHDARQGTLNSSPAEATGSSVATARLGCDGDNSSFANVRLGCDLVCGYLGVWNMKSSIVDEMMSWTRFNLALLAWRGTRSRAQDLHSVGAHTSYLRKLSHLKVSQSLNGFATEILRPRDILCPSGRFLTNRGLVNTSQITRAPSANVCHGRRT